MESLADGTFQGFYLCFSRTQFHGSGHLLQIFPGWKSLFSKWLTETELDPWDRSTNQRCCMKKAVLKSFAIFTGKSLCLSLCLIKLQAFRSGLHVLHDLRPYFQKSKGFQDLNSVEKQVVATLNYLADEGRSGNRKSRKLSGVFCFYSRKYFLCVYLTKQHFVNKKLYRTILFIEN